MIEWLGFLYGIAKDLKDYLEYEEGDKLVDMNWIEKSGFHQKCKEKGYELRWSRSDKVETGILEGWEVLYEVDKIKRIRRRIVLRDGMVLIGKLRR
jgi:hypothetical protein